MWIKLILDSTKKCLKLMKIVFIFWHQLVQKYFIISGLFIQKKNLRKISSCRVHRVHIDIVHWLWLVMLSVKNGYKAIVRLQHVRFDIAAQYRYRNWFNSIYSLVFDGFLPFLLFTSVRQSAYHVSMKIQPQVVWNLNVLLYIHVHEPI